MIHLIINNIFFLLFILDFTKEIDFNKDCDNYYDSLNYKCEDKVCSKKGIKNICYSSSPKSIYTFENKDNIDCNGIITELSGDGKLLNTLQCNNNEFDYSNVDGRYSSIDQESTELKPISNSFSALFQYTEKEYQYYKHSCIGGKYERACDYAANLCALTLYDSNNKFCEIINQLDQELFKNDIL